MEKSFSGQSDGFTELILKDSKLAFEEYEFR